MNTIATQGLKGLLCGIRLADIYSQLKLQGLKPEETEKQLLDAIKAGSKSADDVLLTDFSWVSGIFLKYIPKCQRN